jgi:hypothetical protein
MDILKTLPKDLANIVIGYSDNYDILNLKILDLKWEVKKRKSIKKKICYIFTQKRFIYEYEMWDLKKLTKETRKYQNQIPYDKYWYVNSDSKKKEQIEYKKNVDVALNDLFMYIKGHDLWLKYYVSWMMFSEVKYETSGEKQLPKIEMLLKQTFKFVSLMVELPEFS